MSHQRLDYNQQITAADSKFNKYQGPKEDIRVRENTFLTSGLRLHSLWIVSEIQLRTVMTQMGARGPRRDPLGIPGFCPIGNPWDPPRRTRGGDLGTHGLPKFYKLACQIYPISPGS
mgnify:CR=1 FL=1